MCCYGRGHEKSVCTGRRLTTDVADDATPIRVGLIGLGLLGSAMAERLSNAGFRIYGHDVDAARFSGLSSSAVACESAGDVFQQCRIVLLCLPTSDIAGTVLQECEACLRADQIVVDTTTGQPEQMIAISIALHERHVGYVEATVAGSSVQMRAGQACMFIGGRSNHVERVQSVLAALSSKCFPAGDVGSASRSKLVHNLVLGLNRAVLAEGLMFAESLGFEASWALSVLQNSPAASGVMATKGTKMVASDWSLQARLAQHHKDVQLILDEAETRGAHVPLSQKHAELLQQAIQLGYGDVDNSAVIEAYRNAMRSGTS